MGMKTINGEKVKVKEPINERIEILLDTLGMKKAEFAKTLGISAPAIFQMISGAQNPSSTTITTICQKYNVSEEWLKNGIGDMFIPQTREEEIGNFTKEVMHDADESFRLRLITALSKLTEEQWSALAKLFADTEGTNKNAAPEKEAAED